MVKTYKMRNENKPKITMYDDKIVCNGCKEEKYLNTLLTYTLKQEILQEFTEKHANCGVKKPTANQMAKLIDIVQETANKYVRWCIFNHYEPISDNSWIVDGAAVTNSELFNKFANEK